MILQEKIQKKAEGYGKLAPVFLEGAEFVLKNLGEDKILCNKRDITIDKKLPKSIEERWRLIDRMAAEQSTSRLSRYRESVANSSDLELQKFFNNPYLINMMACCLEYGAKWADAHPYIEWISVKDDLPCNHEELIVDTPLYKRTKPVVCNKLCGIRVDQMVYDTELNGWYWTGETPTHWFPTPKLP